MKIQVIVNPNAGRRTVQKQLEHIIGRLLLEGTASSIQVTRTKARGHATEAAAAIHPGECDLIIACGGDGTINEVLNGLIASGSNTPLAILAAGTSNDFAFSQKLPQTAEKFCQMVRDGQYQSIDIGCANGRYFINVASFGMFTEISHNTDQTSKNLLGKLAYYLHAMREAPEQLAIITPLSIRSAEYVDQGDYQVCLVANSMSVGSLRKLMYQADVTDGVFDVLLMKKKNILPAAGEVLSWLQQSRESLALQSSPPRFYRMKEGDRDPALVYFQTSHIEFEALTDEPIEVDLDGELCGHLPVTIDVAKQAVRLLVPKESELSAFSAPLIKLP